MPDAVFTFCSQCNGSGTPETCEECSNRELLSKMRGGSVSPSPLFMPPMPDIGQGLENECQFAHLITEMERHTAEADDHCIAKAMGITMEALEELYRRAEAVRERVEAGRMPPGRELYWVCSNFSANCKTELGPESGVCPDCGYTTASYKLECRRWR